MEINLLQIYDSRGNPTICAYTKYKSRRIAASVPAGKSTGTHEVVAYPFKDKKPCIEESFTFFKKNRKAIEQAMDFDNQEEFDSFLEELDETVDFRDMGGSLALSLSILHLKFLAHQNGCEVFEYLNPSAKQLPRPLGNVIGGGLHSNNKIPVQEFLVLHNKKKFSENLKCNIRVYNKIAEILHKNKIFFGKNDEGAMSADINFDKALEILENAIKEIGQDSQIGLDVAASSFYKKGNYIWENKKFSENEFNDFLNSLLKKHKNIVYLEDPFNEESFDAFAKLQKKTNALLCGDDLYTTNIARLKIGVAKKSAKSILIKPNQIGTISRTKETVKFAQKHDVVPVISHRSGETCDSIIAHLAVGWKIPFIKTGTVGGERLAKLNELLLIEKLIS